MLTAGKPVKCRAAVIWEVNASFVIEEVEVAVPKKEEVRIRMTSTGLCHSDLHWQKGSDPTFYFPSVFGHEGAGYVESVGEDVTRVQPGDLVVLVFESYCKKCDHCGNPDTNRCRKQPLNNFQMDGTSRITCKGKVLSQMGSLSTFSEYTVTSQYNVAKVNPKGNPNTLCLMGCCMPTGYGAARNTAKVKPGSSCAIWGLGGVGMCVVMGCRDSGASKIIGIDISNQKYEMAKEFGLTHFINPKEVESVPETLKKLTGEGVDYCFVSVGIVPLMEEAFNSSHPLWGKTVVIGLAPEGAKLQTDVWGLLFGKQLMGTFYGSYKAVRDIPGIVDKVVSGQIQLDKLVSHKLPLDRINEGFNLMRSGKAIRVAINYDLKA